MVGDNAPAGRHHGAPKHGDALLAGLLRCRRCGRELTARYTGARHDIPRHSCCRGFLDNAAARCIAFGGLRVGDAIEAEILKVLQPAAVAAAVEAEATASCQRDRVREALMRGVPTARCAANRAFRRYDANEPANRLVAAELEARWNGALGLSPTSTNRPARSCCWSTGWAASTRSCGCRGAAAGSAAAPRPTSSPPSASWS